MQALIGGFDALAQQAHLQPRRDLSEPAVMGAGVGVQGAAEALAGGIETLARQGDQIL